MTNNEVKALCEKEIYRLYEELIEKIGNNDMFDVALLVIATNLVSNAADRRVVSTGVSKPEMLDKMLSDIRRIIEKDWPESVDK